MDARECGLIDKYPLGNIVKRYKDKICEVTLNDDPYEFIFNELVKNERIELNFKHNFLGSNAYILTSLSESDFYISHIGYDMRNYTLNIDKHNETRINRNLYNYIYKLIISNLQSKNGNKFINKSTNFIRESMNQFDIKDKYLSNFDFLYENGDLLLNNFINNSELNLLYIDVKGRNLINTYQLWGKNPTLEIEISSYPLVENYENNLLISANDVITLNKILDEHNKIFDNTENVNKLETDKSSDNLSNKLENRYKLTVAMLTEALTDTNKKYKKGEDNINVSQIHKTLQQKGSDDFYKNLNDTISECIKYRRSWKINK